MSFAETINNINGLPKKTCDERSVKWYEIMHGKNGQRECDKVALQNHLAALHAHILPIVKGFPTMDQYHEKMSTQSRAQTELFKVIIHTINVIKPLIPYARKNVYQDIYNQLLAYKEFPPELLLDIEPIMVPVKHEKTTSHKGRRWGDPYRRRRTSTNWTEELLQYNYTENANFIIKIDEYKNYCDKVVTELIVNETQNNCDNPDTLIDRIGLQECGINNVINTFRSNIQVYKNHSNRVMEKIQNTPQFPQYAQAKLVDDKINEMYNWYPLDERSTINNGFAKLSKQQIIDTLQLWENTVITLYNNCVDNDTHIGIDADNIPLCVNNEYIKSAQRCGQAIKMSKVYEYGTDKLTNLWTDVSNSIPGNLKGQSLGILDSTNNSCKKWVDMFNIWREEEAKAMSEPCAPERPIISANDPVMIKMADEWNNSASDHIAQLKARLIKITKYVRNYPNILHLNKKDIILAPYSMPATANIKIKYDSSESGESPNHYLEMIIPNGKPGQRGDTGVKGIPGYNGYSGTVGDIGNMGQIIESLYYKNK